MPASERCNHWPGQTRCEICRMSPDTFPCGARSRHEHEATKVPDDSGRFHCPTCEAHESAATRDVAPEHFPPLTSTGEGRGKSKPPGGKSSEAPGKSPVCNEPCEADLAKPCLPTCRWS